jgi:hypothetical protein
LFVAAAVPVEKAGDVNPLLEAAKDIGTEFGDKQQTETAVSNAPFDPENPPMPNVQNGTFERFMGSFGSPKKWAGR